MGDEEDDAVPLDDEFAVMLSRQNTNNSRRPGASRKTTRSASSRSTKTLTTKRSNSSKGLMPIMAMTSPTLERTEVEPPSIASLRAEEDHLRHEQEMEIAQKREAAAQLAKDRGLESDPIQSSETVETKPPEPATEANTRPIAPSVTPRRTSSISEIEQRLGLASPLSSTAGYNADSETEPFPSFPGSPVRETTDFGRPP